MRKVLENRYLLKRIDKSSRTRKYEIISLACKQRQIEGKNILKNYRKLRGQKLVKKDKYSVPDMCDSGDSDEDKELKTSIVAREEYGPEAIAQTWREFTDFLMDHVDVSKLRVVSLRDVEETNWDEFLEQDAIPCILNPFVDHHQPGPSSRFYIPIPTPFSYRNIQ